MIKIGQRLLEAREEKGLSLEDVSQSTKIRASFLEAIENGEYEKLPSATYAQGFVRNYARFLGLPEKETLALFKRELDVERNFGVLPQSLSKNYEPSGFRLKQSLFFIVLIFLVILGFIFYQYRSVFFSPELKVTSPLDNSKTYSSRITVLGKTDSNATLFVNGNPVAVDFSGNFRKNLNVFPGKVTIIVRATNRFGKETIVKREVEVKASP